MPPGGVSPRGPSPWLCRGYALPRRRRPGAAVWPLSSHAAPRLRSGGWSLLGTTWELSATPLGLEGSGALPFARSSRAPLVTWLPTGC
eukprot:1614010-Alexandrium_andersonii.AAC.1